jgi:hypothetical protein
MRNTVVSRMLCPRRAIVNGEMDPSQQQQEQQEAITLELKVVVKDVRSPAETGSQMI